MIERQRQRHQRPPGMAHDDRPPDMQKFERLVQQLGLLCRSPGAPARALAVAEPWAIEDDDLVGPDQ